MSDPAEPPAGTPKPATARPGRGPESASFETVRVGARRTRPPFFVLGFLAVIATLVVIGVGGRGPAEPPSAPPVAVDSPSVSPTGRTAFPPPLVSEGESPGASPVASPDAAPILTSGPGPIQIVARRHPETMFIHGDVFVPRVTWVFVSLQDDAGRVAGWASVSVPGAAGPGVGNGPTLRFDVEVAVPVGYEDRLWIQANAYDADGAQVASTRLEVPPGGENAAAGPVRLTEPNQWDEVITTRIVLVDGRLEIRASSVRVALVADDGTGLDSVVIDTTNRDGGIRPVRAPTVQVELALPSPRPEGRLWVVITAYDEAGVEISSMRRPVRIGDLAA
ncbi:MAG TPA: hypothetical protein VMQ65_09505 [Candidatus Limnocylindria bacterium]|nr:hypothetical protein [Candidatus Limnocylindria bacterium]